MTSQHLLLTTLQYLTHIISPLCKNNFIKSLARESQSVQLLRSDDGQHTYQLSLSNSQTLHIPLRYFPALGSHEYHLPALLLSGDEVTALTIEQLVDTIVNEPALVDIISEEQKAIFTNRVLESLDNTAQAIAHSPYQQQLFSQPLDFKTAEQGLLIGHSFHTATKENRRR